MCDLYVCHNPKAVNPETGDIVFLARENSTGKLVWMRAKEGMSPPPDQIIGRATESGQIPQDLIDKLKKAGAGGSAPVLILSGDNVNLSSIPQVNCSGSLETTQNGSQDEKSLTLPSSAQESPKSQRLQPASSKPSIAGIKRNFEPLPSDVDTESEKSNSTKTKRSPLKESLSKSPMLSEKPLLPPLARSSTDGTVPKPRASKRRKFDINHRKIKKPKRPKTGYNYFQLSIRDKLCDKIPMDDRVLHNETVARIIGKKWKALSKQERKVFQNLAEQDKSRYERELKEYLEKMYELGADGRCNDARGTEKKKGNFRRCFSVDTALSSRKGGGALRKNKRGGKNVGASRKADEATDGPAGEHVPKLEPQSPGSDRDPMSIDSPDSKSRLAQQISNALGGALSGFGFMGANGTNSGGGSGFLPPSALNPSSSIGSPSFFAPSGSPRPDKWLDDDAFAMHLGGGSSSSNKLKSSLSCENIPLSSSLFDSNGFFTVNGSTDRDLTEGRSVGSSSKPFGGSNPFAPADDLYLSSFSRENNFLEPGGILGGGASKSMGSSAFSSLPSIDNLFFKGLSSWDDH
eukprot:CAMPEP_0184488102 /NCGR_PEP_ID=MMETSP0113_2-20130426/10525_1 /TAXON_ID=91329 /ORGANISM="Norrisiella sphaerica, Strain BC52" /LENGTH=574 /DNA_ID=CAMNT_0026870579 /DNA_START=182 /DNA_END=1906 /DNA_ORIENTATION=+